MVINSLIFFTFGLLVSNCKCHTVMIEEQYLKTNGSTMFTEPNDNVFFTWCFTIISSCLVGLSGIFPLFIIPLHTGKYLQSKAGLKNLNRLLSFGVGSILGDVFLHLLPEAWDHTRKLSGVHHNIFLGLWIVTGLVVFFAIEMIFMERDSCDISSFTQQKKVNDNKSSDRHRNSMKISKKSSPSSTSKIYKEKDSDSAQQLSTVNQNIMVQGYLNLLANVIDNFTHGLAVAGSYLVSTRMGMLTTFCILVHEIPHEVSDFAILLRSGFDRWRAARLQFYTAFGGIAGSFFALLADAAITDCMSWILPFTSGGFLYIALVTLIPSLLDETNPRESIMQLLFIVIGLTSMFFVSVYL